MQRALEKLVEQNTQQAAQISALIEQNAALTTQINLLQKKIQFLLGRLFGRKSEKLSRNQLEFLLTGLDPVDAPDDDPSPSSPPPGRKRPRRESKPRLPADLPTEEQVIIPDEVRQNPNAYQRIGEEVTEELDVVPTRYFRRRIVRPKFKRKERRDLAPVIAPMPPRVIEGSYASPGLLSDIVLKKYADHLPLYRQEQILRTRHGIELSRKTMCDWVGVVAEWLKPIYNHLREDLRNGAYLQADETPVQYCMAEGGGSAKGYLWLFHRPGGEVVYEWYTSRATECLDSMLEEFSGTVQCDGYAAYTSYAKKRRALIEAQQSDKPIELAGCWAHARRKFYAAIEECPVQAGWILKQIGLMYGIEKQLGDTGPALRQAVRSAETAMVLRRLEKALKLKLAQHLPKSQMGEAISYTLSLWHQLLHFRDNGLVEIDNNPVENAVRPTALGKKNWMFIGHPDAGERSAIIYTLLQSCKRHGINPRDYLQDVLTRIPAMKNHQTRSLTPENWLAERSKSQAA